MRKLLSILFGMTFVGAQCGSPSGLTRTCSGSTAQTLFYKVGGGCGAAGTISVSVASAGSCIVNVIEDSPVMLPESGSFNASAGASGYDLAKGNWNLSDPSMGNMDVGTFLNCTGTAATSTGCMAHLSPAPAGASIGVDVPDAGMPTLDATVPPG
jgi:hypothetical protein